MPYADPVKQRRAQSLSAKKHYKKNRRKIRARAKAWYHANKAKALAGQRRYWAAHRTEQRKYMAARQRAIRAVILLYKLFHPCIDCGERDPDVLTFDHRDPKKKLKSIGKMRNVALGTLLAEIRKCDVRCCNCHMKKTLQQWRDGVLVSRWSNAGVDPRPVLAELEAFVKEQPACV